MEKIYLFILEDSYFNDDDNVEIVANDFKEAFIKFINLEQARINDQSVKTLFIRGLNGFLKDEIEEIITYYEHFFNIYNIRSIHIIEQTIYDRIKLERKKEIKETF